MTLDDLGWLWKYQENIHLYLETTPTKFQDHKAKKKEVFVWCYIEKNRVGRSDFFLTCRTTDRDNRTTVFDNRTGKLLEQQQQMFTVLSFISILILKQSKRGRSNQYIERVFHYHCFLSLLHENNK